MKPEGDALQFMQHMWKLVHALEVRSKRMAKSIGVTGPQRLVIRLIGQRPNLTPTELAAMMNVHPSTLTGAIARLEARALVTRVVDAGDRRRVRLTLTPAGKQIDKLQRGTVEAAVRRAIGRIGQDRIAETRLALDQVIAELARTE